MEKTYEIQFKMKNYFFKYIFAALFSLFWSQSFLFANDEIGVTSLMQAAVSGDVEGARFFSKIDKTRINYQNLGGATALHIASRNGNFEIVKILLDANIDANLLDNEGYNAAMRAVVFSDDEVVKAILAKNLNISQLNKNGEGLISLAAKSSCDECLILVLEKINAGYDFPKILLKRELENAFKISSAKNNDAQKDVLKGFISSLEKKSEDLNKPKIIAKKKEVPPAKIFNLTKDASSLQKSLPKIDKSKKTFILNKLPAVKKVEMRQEPKKSYKFKALKADKKKVKRRKKFKLKPEAVVVEKKKKKVFVFGAKKTKVDKVFVIK